MSINHLLRLELLEMKEAIWMIDRPSSSQISQRSKIIEKSDRTLVQTDRIVYAVQLLVVSERGDASEQWA